MTDFAETGYSQYERINNARTYAITADGAQGGTGSTTGAAADSEGGTLHAPSCGRFNYS
jgi:hypothetical protein